jgi:hypothetical protein
MIEMTAIVARRPVALQIMHYRIKSDCGVGRSQKAEEILSVPEDVEVVAMTPLGCPAAEGSARRRKEFSEVASYEKRQGKKT